MKSRQIAIAVGIMALGLAAGVAAQSINDIEFEAITGKAVKDAGSLEEFVNHALRRGDEFQDEAQQVTEAAFEKLGDLPANEQSRSSAGTIDLDELVSGASVLVKGGRGGAPLFMVFASTSMPPESLKPLIEHTAAAGGVVVFRGFPNNSAKEFLGKIRQVVAPDQKAARITIDPRLFRAFNVQRVPTFVVAGTDFEPCDALDCVTPEPPSDKLTGNVTVRYALEQFSTGGGTGSRIAGVALRNLQGKTVK